ncbi:MAG: hypothetical protein BYD32DRAFT_458522 [Podila humilis]|nr:MAG: hypothetical protein BYD32DRAFT_458522 [Podila humilis]
MFFAGHSRTPLVNLLAFVSIGLLFIILNSKSRSSLFAPLTTAPSKPRYIIVNLGIGNGEALEMFLKNSETMSDLPKPKWAEYHDAELFLFEANPYYNSDLVELKQKYSLQGIKVEIFPSTLVGVKNGLGTFMLDSEKDYHGSSSTEDNGPGMGPRKMTDLTVINFSQWLLMNVLPQDFVVVKMSIKGAEYDVVPHMAEMGLWAVVDHLLVDWHSFDIGGATPEEIQYRDDRAAAALAKLEAEGVKM